MLMLGTKTRSTDRQIVAGLEAECRTHWALLHQWRQRYRQGGEEWCRKAAIDTWYTLRLLLSLRRGG